MPNAARTTASTRSSGSSGAAFSAASMTSAISRDRGLEDGIDELLLAGEPVQDGLLAHADDGGDLVQRHGVDTAGAEAVEGRAEDTVTGGDRGGRHARCLPLGSFSTCAIPRPTRRAGRRRRDDRRPSSGARIGPSSTSASEVDGIRAELDALEPGLAHDDPGRPRAVGRARRRRRWPSGTSELGPGVGAGSVGRRLRRRVGAVGAGRCSTPPPPRSRRRSSDREMAGTVANERLAALAAELGWTPTVTNFAYVLDAAAAAAWSARRLRTTGLRTVDRRRPPVDRAAARGRVPGVVLLGRPARRAGRRRRAGRARRRGRRRRRSPATSPVGCSPTARATSTSSPSTRPRRGAGVGRRLSSGSSGACCRPRRPAG